MNALLAVIRRSMLSSRPLQSPSSRSSMTNAAPSVSIALGTALSECVRTVAEPPPGCHWKERIGNRGVERNFGAKVLTDGCSGLGADGVALVPGALRGDGRSTVRQQPDRRSGGRASRRCVEE